MTNSKVPDRERALDAIRETYLGYEREGRYREWDPRNPGNARMERDRDRELVDLMRRSLPSTGGRVLDLGMGYGRLAEVARGTGLPFGSWTGVDLDPRAVAAANTASPWAYFVEASGDQLPFDARTFDVVVASTLFSSLPSGHLERGVASEIKRVLVPGGWLVWYDLRYNNPRNPAVHSVPPAELRRLFVGWRMELHSVTLAPPLARRLGLAVPIVYPLFVKIPFLRSHLIGRLQRPA